MKRDGLTLMHLTFRNKRVGQSFLYFDSFNSLILAEKYCNLFFILHNVWTSSEIYGSYSPNFSMKIVHNTTKK